MGAQLIKEVASKTNDVAGDGTTTATVLAQAMVHEGMKNLAAGANPIILRKGMKKATDNAVEAIKEMSQKRSTAKNRSQMLLLSLQVMKRSDSWLQTLWKSFQRRCYHC